MPGEAPSRLAPWLTLAGASASILSLWLPHLHVNSSEAWWDYCRYGCTGPERPDLDGLYFLGPALVTAVLGGAALIVGVLAWAAPRRVPPSPVLLCLALALPAWGLVQVLFPGFEVIPFKRLPGLWLQLVADVLTSIGLLWIQATRRHRADPASTTRLSLDRRHARS